MTTLKDKKYNNDIHEIVCNYEDIKEAVLKLKQKIRDEENTLYDSEIDEIFGDWEK